MEDRVKLSIRENDSPCEVQGTHKESGLPGPALAVRWNMREPGFGTRSNLSWVFPSYVNAGDPFNLSESQFPHLRKGRDMLFARDCFENYKNII